MIRYISYPFSYIQKIQDQSKKDWVFHDKKPFKNDAEEDHEDEENPPDVAIPSTSNAKELVTPKRPAKTQLLPKVINEAEAYVVAQLAGKPTPLYLVLS